MRTDGSGNQISKNGLRYTAKSESRNRRGTSNKNTA